jgi:hypothetical protein
LRKVEKLCAGGLERAIERTANIKQTRARLAETAKDKLWESWVSKILHASLRNLIVKK